MQTLLFLGAFSPEIDLLKKYLHLAPLPFSQIRCFWETRGKSINSFYSFPQSLSEEEKFRVEVLETGIGSLASALSLQERLLSQDNPVFEIIFLGSCGIYRNAFSHKESTIALSCDFSHDFSFIWSRQFYYCDPFVMKGHAKLPEDMKTRMQTRAGSISEYLLEYAKDKQSDTKQLTDKEIASEGEGEINLKINHNHRDEIVFQTGGVNTTTGVSLVEFPFPQDPSPLSHSMYPFYFENLEAFGLAQVSSRFCKSFTVFLACTNEVGPDASQEWSKNYRPMSHQMQNFIIKALCPESHAD